MFVMTRELQFLKPNGFDEVHADKLFKGLDSRFRFNQIKLDVGDRFITISYTCGHDIINHLSDYINGFFDSI